MKRGSLEMEEKPKNQDEKSVPVSIKYGTSSGATSTVATVSATPTSTPIAAMSSDEDLIQTAGGTVKDKLPLIPFDVKEASGSPEPEERKSTRKFLEALKSGETDRKRKKQSIGKKSRKNVKMRKRRHRKNRSNRGSATDDNGVGGMAMMKANCFFFMAAFSILTAVIIMSFCATFHIRWGQLSELPEDYYVVESLKPCMEIGMALGILVLTFLAPLVLLRGMAYGFPRAEAGILALLLVVTALISIFVSFRGNTCMNSSQGGPCIHVLDHIHDAVLQYGLEDFSMNETRALNQVQRVFHCCGYAKGTKDYEKLEARYPDLEELQPDDEPGGEVKELNLYPLGCCATVSKENVYEDEEVGRCWSTWVEGCRDAVLRDLRTARTGFLVLSFVLYASLLFAFAAHMSC